MILTMYLDGVSIVGGEELHMDKWGIDIAMTGSTKSICMSTRNFTNMHQSEN